MRVLVVLMAVISLPAIIKYMSRKLVGLCLLFYILGVLVLTLGRSSGDKPIVVLDILLPYKTIFGFFIRGYQKGGITEAVKRMIHNKAPIDSIILNILLFIPYGYLMPETFVRLQGFWKVLVSGLLFSLLIETLQLVNCLGWFDVSDIIHNCIGVCIGFMIHSKRLKGERNNIN